MATFALVACSKSSTKPPSLTGTWEVRGNSDVLKINDHDGSLIGVLKRGGEELLLNGTRSGKTFDLSGDRLEETDAIRFYGTIDDPTHISGTYFLAGRLFEKVTWHADCTTKYIPGLTETYGFLSRTYSERRQAMRSLAAPRLRQ